MGNNTRMSGIIFLMSHNTGGFNQNSEAGKWNKMHIDYKINIEIIFLGDMIIYI